MRGKKLHTKFNNIHVRLYNTRRHKIKIRYLVAALALTMISIPIHVVQAVGCPDLRVVFARGSGGELNNDPNYLEFKSAIDDRMKGTGVSYDFVDLDYPAIGVGIDNLKVALGAYFGSGDAYEFGKSVDSGVEKLQKMINGISCPNTKYVIGGYSQGAMVISKSLPGLNPERIIYAATFGDPKLYLPEGKGLFPPACQGKDLSDYRMYVPDCKAYKGLLGAYEPYRPDAFIGKVGTWCNKHDVFCSHYLNIDDHLKYVSDNLYEDAAKVIFNKIAQQYGIEARVVSDHDTAILIDSSGSMSGLIRQYKDEAYRLAKETLNSGGRVALFDYRDLKDPYEPVERCNFETCTLERFRQELDNIKVDGGGDTPESLLSASFQTMKSLKWKYGATKSLVVLTDAGFLAPDRDGVTIEQVIKLSKEIDPVNFYIITKPSNESEYHTLAAETGGKVVTNLDELSLLTDYIMERFDSLPRVDEVDDGLVLPTLTVVDTKQTSDDGIEIEFQTDGKEVLVLLNDRVLGKTNDTKITITGLDKSMQNTISLIPLNEVIRGEGVAIDVSSVMSPTNSAIDIIPKAPNTGKQ